MKSACENQLKQEHIAWQKSLELLRQENVLLKYHLSEVVDNNEGNQFLQIAEYFQNELLLKDEILKKLTKKLKIFIHLAEGDQNEKKLTESIIADHDRLRKDIMQFEKNFLNLSNEFNEKMSKNTAY